MIYLMHDLRRHACPFKRVSGDGRPLQRGASMTTTEHVDPAAIPSVDPALDDDGNPSDVRLRRRRLSIHLLSWDVCSSACL